MRKLIVIALLAASPGAAHAQDIQPVLSLPDLAQSQVISSTANAQARRQAVRNRRHHANQPLNCADYAQLKARRGDLSRAEYARYYACRQRRR